MRQIIAPKGKKSSQEAIDVSLIEDGDEDGQIINALQQDRAEIHHAPRALPSDAYEDRLRHAREAVKTDSKQVAQVVKDWVASDE
jgi:flagellar M-ring protein FliF